MRILIAADVPRQKEAGSAGVVLNYARELQRRGHTVECWFFEDVVGDPVRPGRFSTLVFAIRVARRIRRSPEAFDVVNLCAPTGAVYGLWRKVFPSKRIPPYVFTMQGVVERYALNMWFEQKKGRAWHFQLKNRLWHRFYHQSLFDYSIKTADYGMASNREAWTFAELKHRREPGRLWYVPNGTEDHFFIERIFRDGEAQRWLFVGTWLDRKGIYYLIDAFESAVRKNPSIHLTVAGTLGREEDVTSMFTPEARHRVQVISFVERKDMPKLYADHDIFVFPSLMEGMPLSLMEAMATAMPVVTTETCGMADVVEDGFNGLLVPAGDAEKLIAAIEKLSGCLELRQRLGLAAQQTMRRYTWERVADKVEMILSLAANEGKTS